MDATAALTIRLFPSGKHRVCPPWGQPGVFFFGRCFLFWPVFSFRHRPAIEKMPSLEAPRDFGA
ncbi:MAG TPA: hypothetical protein VGA56_13100, partial [Opitutaceae bacterium]